MTWDSSPCSTEDKLKNFPKYVGYRAIGRFLAMYEIFKLQIGVKGSIVECGVHQGGSLLLWQRLSMLLEPHNTSRRIIGFDTFNGFPEVSPLDGPVVDVVDFSSGDYSIVEELVGVLREDEFSKIDLAVGDAKDTIPAYLEKWPHTLVSLLFLDFDIYEPTKLALKSFLPRMPKGAIVVFDEVNNIDWPGETIAMLECMDIRETKIECFPWERNLSFVRL